MQDLEQNFSTSLLASPLRDRLHFLAVLELPIARPSFVSHLLFIVWQERRNFLQLRLLFSTERNLSIQPEHRKMAASVHHIVSFNFVKPIIA